METIDNASRKVKQVGRQIESSVGNLKNMMSQISLVGDAKHFGNMGEDETNKLKIKLNSKNEKDKLEGMKKIVAMMTINRDCSTLFPDIVKLVCVESMEVKKLVYMYVVKYASSNGDLALLAISSFQKDMSSPNPLVRAKALQAMSSMNVSSVTHLIIMQLKNAVKDSSEYVRRTCAQILPIVYKMDIKFKTDLVSMLATLLNDDNVVVLSGAIYAFNFICPQNFDLIHSNYRKICHLLADMDEYGQIVALDLLLRYIRNQFSSPFVTVEQETDNVTIEEKKDNNEDNLEEDYYETDDVELDPDHKMAVSCCKNLIYSMNSQVVLGTVTLLYYCAPSEHCSEAVSNLMSFISSKREISYSVLANISTMCSSRPELFQSYYKEFFIKATEPNFTKELKLDILSKIANDSNISNILKEFQTYSNDNDVKFRCSTIDAMGRLVACSINNKTSNVDEISELTMKLLMNLIGNENQCEEVVGSSIIVIRQIIQRNPEKYSKSMLKLLKLLSKTNVPKARCAITWIIGEYRQFIQQYAPDALRILAKTFIKENDIVKMQILNFSVKIYLSNPSKKLQKLFKHILDLCKYDKNYDLRDRARLIRFVFFPKKKKKNDDKDVGNESIHDNFENLNVDVHKKLRTIMQQMFLAEKSLPEVISPFKDRDRFVMSSLSHIVIHEAGNNYKRLEDFPKQPPDNSDKRNPKDSNYNKLSPNVEKSFSFSNTDNSSVVTMSSESDSDSGSETESTSESKTNDKESDEETETVEEASDKKNHQTIDEESSSEIISMESTESAENLLTGSTQHQDIPKQELNDNNKTANASDLITFSKNQNSKSVNNVDNDIDDDSSISSIEDQKNVDLDTVAKETNSVTKTTDIFQDLLSEQAPNNPKNTNYGLSDILFGGNISLLSSTSDNSKTNLSSNKIGVSGELLNHTHSGGLQINYKYIRSQSKAGTKYNTIELAFKNCWDKDFNAISLKPHNLDQNQQDLIGFGMIHCLKINEEQRELIQVKFGRSSEMRIEVCCQGTSKSKFISKIKLEPGESMRSYIYDVEEFQSKLKKMQGITERKISCELKNLDEASQLILKTFNVAPLVDKNMKDMRFFASKLLNDDSDVFITLQRDEHAIVCSIYCSEYMLIDSLRDLAKSVLCK